MDEKSGEREKIKTLAVIVVIAVVADIKMEIFMKKFSRRDFFKVAGGAVIGAATYGLTDNISHSFAQSPVIASTKINDNNYIGSKAKVYFSSQINTDSLLKLYNLINEGI